MTDQPYLNLGRPLGSWVWNVSYYVVNPDELFRFCRKNHVTELYFSINRDVTDARYADLIRHCCRVWHPCRRPVGRSGLDYAG